MGKQASAKAPLVKIAKFAALPNSTGFAPVSKPENRKLTEEEAVLFSRIERYALKSVAESILCPDKKWARLYRCNRYRLGKEVEVWRNSIRKTASFRKVETCGSVWVCPVCSPKITERRRLELVQGVQAHREKDGVVYFMTLTFPHKKSDVLEEILNSFLSAVRWMTSHKRYKQGIKSLFGIEGYVRALEPTQGDNGWHPHCHYLLFLEKPLDKAHSDILEGVLFDMWSRACKAKGLPQPKFGIGVNIKAATTSTEEIVAEYMAKFGKEPEKIPHWTSTHELTKAMSKHGRKKGRTPWDILRSILEEDNVADRALFREYANAFKGKNLLTWSNGMREMLGLNEELSDEELAAQAAQDENELFLNIDAPTWGRICVAHAWPLVLAAVGSGDWDEIEKVFAELPELPSDWQLLQTIVKKKEITVGVKRAEKEQRRKKRKEKKEKAKELKIPWSQSTRDMFDTFMDRPHFENFSDEEVTLPPGFQVGEYKTKNQILIRNGILYAESDDDFQEIMHWAFFDGDKTPDDMAKIFGTKVVSFRGPLEVSGPMFD
jgi:hypothetical protein